MVMEDDPAFSHLPDFNPVGKTPSTSYSLADVAATVLWGTLDFA